MSQVATSPTPIRWVLALGGLLLALVAAGVSLSSPFASILLCLLLLVVGLPHGALDLELLRSAARDQTRSLFGVTILYLALAVVAFAVWQWSPALALGLFLLIAAAHFSEDWRSFGEPLLGTAMAAAMLSAPALLHRAELSTIFEEVTGSRAGAMLTNFQLMVAPVALLIAVVGIADLVRRRRRSEALVAGMLLAGMVVLPPLAGFALFFCAYHSPLHLREVWESLHLPRARMLGISVAITGLALFGAGVLVAIEWRGSLSSSVIAATFATFAILTVPHMLAPLILRRKDGRDQEAEASSCPAPNICGMASASKP